jgi:hypothetical protein
MTTKKQVFVTLEAAFQWPQFHPDERQPGKSGANVVKKFTAVIYEFS